MARANNSPTNWKENVEITDENNILRVFNSFRKLPPVNKADVEGVKERLDRYFEVCADAKFIPTVESMMLCLGISRQAAWKWQKAECEAGLIIDRAKQYINAMIASAAMSGQTPFPYAIWLQKNHFGYSDLQKLEIQSVDNERKALTAADLPKLGNFTPRTAEQLPRLEHEEEGEN